MEENPDITEIDVEELWLASGPRKASSSSSAISRGMRSSRTSSARGEG
jgi:hypothetical protein